MFDPELPEPTEADKRKCARRVAKLGFNQGHEWAKGVGVSNFRYCKRCHEPGWEMPATNEETASA